MVTTQLTLTDIVQMTLEEHVRGDHRVAEDRFG